jgi:virulence factor
MQRLIKYFKGKRKASFLGLPQKYKQTYALVGTGSHTISVLMPVLHHLAIPIRYVVSKDPGNAALVAQRFPECSALPDIDALAINSQVKACCVSVDPSLHFGFIKALLKNGKYIFVEKPPCYSKMELQELISLDTDKRVMVGLQKRFSAINRLLRSKVGDASSYHYRYATGSFPEGNALYELFIHPVDNLLQLFGSVKKLTISKKRSANNFIALLQIVHINGVIGSMELSTCGDWTNAEDILTITTDSELLTAKYPLSLEGVVKSRTALGIPIEKVVAIPTTTRQYINANQFSLTAQNNPVALSGFVGELEHFANIVEANGKFENGLLSLVEVYDLLEQIEKTPVT